MIRDFLSGFLHQVLAGEQKRWWTIQGQPYVSDILVGRATGRPGVFLTNPVVTAEGEIMGIDIVWLKGDAIWGIIDDVVVGEEGIAYTLPPTTCRSLCAW